MKICATCHNEKKDFYRQISASDGLQSSCKDCVDKRDQKRKANKFDTNAWLLRWNK